MSNLWDYTNELENLFKKYGLAPPQYGERNWEPKLMELLRLLDEKCSSQS